MRIKSMLPAWRRRSSLLTTRSLGAEAFRANAVEMQSTTERVLDAILSDGGPSSGARTTAVDFHAMVRRHRQSIARKIENDLALQEIVEHVDRLAAIAGLHSRNPELLTLIVTDDERETGGPSADDKEALS